MQSVFDVKKVVLLFCMIIFINLASANVVPQVFFSSVNLTLVNGSMHLWGEGLDARDSFSCLYSNVTNTTSINYERYNIPLTFSRNIESNQTDVAVLINALNNDNNMTAKWTECMNEVTNAKVNLSVCQEQGAYKENYTSCSNTLVSCQSTSSINAAELNTQKSKVDEVTQQRTVLIVICVALGLIAYNYYNKTNINKVETPFNKFPAFAKM